jgi:hypothetical protein
MTDAGMDLHSLLERTKDTAMLRDIIGVAAERLPWRRCVNLGPLPDAVHAMPWQMLTRMAEVSSGPSSPRPLPKTSHRAEDPQTDHPHGRRPTTM